MDESGDLLADSRNIFNTRITIFLSYESGYNVSDVRQIQILTGNPLERGRIF
jgi:hypothetical protein